MVLSNELSSPSPPSNPPSYVSPPEYPSPPSYSRKWPKKDLKTLRHLNSLNLLQGGVSLPQRAFGPDEAPRNVGPETTGSFGPVTVTGTFEPSEGPIGDRETILEENIGLQIPIHQSRKSIRDNSCCFLGTFILIIIILISLSEIHNNY